MQHESTDPCLPQHSASPEERLASEIACLKSALLKLDGLRDEPGYQWVREFYEKIIERREAVLHGLTEWRRVPWQ